MPMSDPMTVIMRAGAAAHWRATAGPATGSVAIGARVRLRIALRGPCPEGRSCVDVPCERGTEFPGGLE